MSIQQSLVSFISQFPSMQVVITVNTNPDHCFASTSAIFSPVTNAIILQFSLAGEILEMEPVTKDIDKYPKCTRVMLPIALHL